MHQRQIVDFRVHRKHNPGGKKRRKGRPTSKWVRPAGARHDQLVDWARPGQGRRGSGPEQFAAMPPTLRVREIRYAIPRKGQRTLCVTIATTLPG
jgi:hypothetical protein